MGAEEGGGGWHGMIVEWARSDADTRPKLLGDEVLHRTYISVPEDMLDQLRKMAVRRSVKENRQTSVSEIVVEMLKHEMRRNHR